MEATFSHPFNNYDDLPERARGREFILGTCCVSYTETWGFFMSTIYNRGQQMFSVKGQIRNIWGFVGHKLFYHNFSAPPLSCKSNHRQRVNKKACLFSTKTFSVQIRQQARFGSWATVCWVPMRCACEIALPEPWIFGELFNRLYTLVSFYDYWTQWYSCVSKVMSCLHKNACFPFHSGSCFWEVASLAKLPFLHSW